MNIDIGSDPPPTSTGVSVDGLFAFEQGAPRLCDEVGGIPCFTRVCRLGPLNPLIIRSAGVLSVAALALDAGAPLTLMPDDAGTYLGQWPTLEYQPGQRLRVQATGGVVASFSAELEVPSRVEFVSPRQVQGPLQMTRGMPLTFTWNGDGGGAVTLFVSNRGATESVELRCRAPVSSGALTIPWATLRAIDLDGGAFFSFSNLVATQVQAGPTPVDVILRSNGYTGFFDFQ